MMFSAQKGKKKTPDPPGLSVDAEPLDHSPSTQIGTIKPVFKTEVIDHFIKRRNVIILNNSYRTNYNEVPSPKGEKKSPRHTWPGY